MKNETTKRINEPSLYILLALMNRPMSGYEITGEVMKITKGRLEIRTGTMYPALKILFESNDIQLVEVEKIERNKKIYEITEKGIDRVNEEKKRLENTLEEIKSATEGGNIYEKNE
ncbi:MAG: PadR family transcriptional regulator [Alkaliphilus sp.]